MMGEIDQVDNVVRFQSTDKESSWNNKIKYSCEQELIKKDLHSEAVL
jgi:hypothetical protein